MQVTSALPADAAFQVTRTAGRLGFADYSDVLAEVANAVIRTVVNHRDSSHVPAPALAGGSFPQAPLTGNFGTQLSAGRTGRTNVPSNSRQPKHARSR
jgi:hypothetical protein